MIIKVQISLFTSEGSPQALFYNKRKSVVYQETASLELLAIMNGRTKAFFKAIVVNSKLGIGEEVPDPGW